MAHLLTVKPDDKVDIWLVFIDGRPVEGFNRDCEKLVTLAPGVHRLSYLFNGPGSSIEINLAGDFPIIPPPQRTWPIKDKVPDDQTGTTDNVRFTVPR